MNIIGFLAPSGMVIAFCLAAHAFAGEPALQYASIEGGRIEYVATGPADGEPLLLIHGAMLGTAFALVQEQPALAGYRVMRMHRRGYAGSSDPERPMSVADHAADALALLDALGSERAHVAGHSSGAGFILEMVSVAPERFQTVILVDSGPISGLAPPSPPPQEPSGPSRQPNPIGDAMSRLDAGDREGAIAAFASFVFGEDWREFFDAVPGGFEQAVADAGRDIPGTAPWTFSRAQIEAIDRPTLVLWGDEDRRFAERSMALARVLPRAEGRGIAGTDHALITQKPGDVAKAIADFIARHPM